MTNPSMAAAIVGAAESDEIGLHSLKKAPQIHSFISKLLTMCVNKSEFLRERLKEFFLQDLLLKLPNIFIFALNTSMAPQ